MASTESTTIRGTNVYVTTCGFLTGTVVGDAGGSITAGSPSADAVTPLATVVPADGAELKSITFTVTSPGTVTTSGTQQWSISDGTNVLATQAAIDTEQAAGTILTLVMGSATNGKNIASTAGARLTMTNTEVGTIGDAMHGIFNLVWGL